MALKILIAEDEKILAKVLGMKLKAAGYDIATVADGEAALAIMQKEKFDLALLDLYMPKKNGFEVLTAVKEKNIKVKIIVASNLSRSEDLEKAKSLGALDYIVKSETSLDEIVNRLHLFLKQ